MLEGCLCPQLYAASRRSKAEHSSLRDLDVDVDIDVDIDIQCSKLQKLGMWIGNMALRILK